MGALHQGHISLVQACRAACDLVVVSIFVNPLQFNNQADFDNYPSTLAEDQAMLQAAGAHVIFAPSAQEMYGSKPQLSINVGPLDQRLEGAFRPGHFAGVAMVVARLFNLVQPQHAYFGQKDLQQCAVIRRLVDDLDFGIELHFCPTLREDDGLAMSSRNRRLGPAARQQAPFIYEVLQQCRQLFLEKGGEAAQNYGRQQLTEHGAFTLEYLEVIDPHSFELVQQAQPGQPVAIAVAAWLDGVRLIDNLVFEAAPQ